MPNVRQLTTNYDQYGGPYVPWITDDGSVIVYDEAEDVGLATSDGQNRRRLTDIAQGQGYCAYPRPSADGNSVAMQCTANVTGQNADGNSEIVSLQLIQFVAVTQSPGGVYNESPDISGDGRTIVFTSNGNYTGGNVDGSDEVFLSHDGQLRQITRSSGDSFGAQISANGQRILFTQSQQGAASSDNDNSGAAGLLYLYDDATGQTTQLTSAEASQAQLTRDGGSVIFSSRADLVGSNPYLLRQIYAQQIGGAVRQLTQITDPDTFISGFAANANASRIAIVLANSSSQPGETFLVTNSGTRSLPGVPADASNLSFDNTGRLLAFISSEDPVRENSQHYRQLFVAEFPLDVDTPTPVPTSTPSPAPPALGSDIGATETTILLNDASTLPSSGTIQVDAELMTYTSRSASALFGVTRGACGTIATEHSAGSRVTLVAGGCPPTPTPTATPTPRPSATLTATPKISTCVGDCNGLHDVTVGEILTMVNIALGNSDISSCRAGDANGDAQITVDEILTAVNHALNGCD